MKNMATNLKLCKTKQHTWSSKTSWTCSNSFSYLNFQKFLAIEGLALERFGCAGTCSKASMQYPLKGDVPSSELLKALFMVTSFFTIFIGASYSGSTEVGGWAGRCQNCWDGVERTAGRTGAQEPEAIGSKEGRGLGARGDTQHWGRGH